MSLPSIYTEPSCHLDSNPYIKKMLPHKIHQFALNAKSSEHFTVITPPPSVVSYASLVLHAVYHDVIPSSFPLVHLATISHLFFEFSLFTCSLKFLHFSLRSISLHTLSSSNFNFCLGTIGSKIFHFSPAWVQTHILNCQTWITSTTNSICKT